MSSDRAQHGRTRGPRVPARMAHLRTPTSCEGRHEPCSTPATTDRDAQAAGVSPGEFDCPSYQARFRNAVREGLAALEAGRVFAAQELETYLERVLGACPP